MRRRTVWLLLLAADVLIVRPHALARQRDVASAPVGTATVSGQVVSDETPGRPLRRATVNLVAPDLRVPLSTVTDEAGRFSFGGVPAGTYNLTASKPSYVGAFYGSTRAGRGPGVGVVVRDGDRVGNLTIALTRGSVIAGTLRLPSGQPAEGMVVIVAGLDTAGGQPRLRLAGGHATTDDRGRYRVYGLAAGDYLVQAQPSGLLLGAPTAANDALQTASAEVSWAEAVAKAQGRAGVPALPPPDAGYRVNYATVYFPGTPDPAGASTVKVAAGEERDGIDFSLVLEPTAAITGVTVGPDGAPVANADVTVVADHAALDVAGMLAPRPKVRTARDGTFTLPAVGPGRYRLVAQAKSGAAAGGDAGGPLWAEQDVVVSGQDAAGVTLLMRSGMHVSGRVVSDSNSARPDALARARVTLTLAADASSLLPPVSSATSASASVGADGTFDLAGLVPGSYRVAITMPGLRARPDAGAEPWTLVSILRAGADVTDGLLLVSPGENVGDVVVTITDRPAELTGTLTDRAGRAAPGYPIVIFPTDRADWRPGSRRVAVVRPSVDGGFRVVGLPAGTYYLCAVVDLDPADVDDPAFLQTLAPAALTVTLTEGTKIVQDLRLAGGLAPW